MLPFAAEADAAPALLPSDVVGELVGPIGAILRRVFVVADHEACCGPAHTDARALRAETTDGTGAITGTRRRQRGGQNSPVGAKIVDHARRKHARHADGRVERVVLALDPVRLVAASRLQRPVVLLAVAQKRRVLVADAVIETQVEELGPQRRESGVIEGVGDWLLYSKLVNQKSLSFLNGPLSVKPLCRRAKKGSGLLARRCRFG